MNINLAVGEQIRHYRTAAHKTKTVVAGLAGISPDYLYQIEKGQKLPTIAVLAQLADVLGREPGDLLRRGPAVERPQADEIATAATAIYRALTVRQQPGTVPTLPNLQREVAEAWRTWQTSPRRYSALTTELPGLIGDVENVLRNTDNARTPAQACAADLYCLLRTVTKRIGRTDLSLLAADRSVRAAEASDDPVRLAGAHWNLTQVLLADNQADEAEDVAMRAVEDLRPLQNQGHQDGTALSGALLLIAAVAAARRGDGWTARSRLHQAAPLAEQTGERNVCWTAFGPTNVAMYAVNVEVETGEAVEGLRLAERVDHDRSPSIERRVAFLLDQARGYQQRRDYGSALLLLQAAETEAPEDIRYRPAAHGVLRTVTERGRRSVSQQAVRLATRLNLPMV